MTTPAPSILAHAEAITLQESGDLVRLENKIAQGLQTFVEVGEALAEIRDRRLYRIEHATFADYCKVKWQMSDRRARQLMDASEVVADLSKSGTIVPKTESQARPLTKLPPQKRAEAWQAAVESTPTAAPTARAVEAVVARRAGTPAKPAGYDDGMRELADAAKDAEREIERLNRLNASLSDTDHGHAIVALNGKYEAVNGRVNQLLETESQMRGTLKYQAGILDKCRKLLGVEKNAGIVPAIEASRTGTPSESGRTALQQLTHYWQRASAEDRQMFDNFRAGFGCER